MKRFLTLGFPLTSRRGEVAGAELRQAGHDYSPTVAARRCPGWRPTGHRRGILGLACMLLTCSMVSGCGGPPQVSPGNFRLISALRTATSSKQIDWVEESAKQLEEEKSRGRVSDAEYAAFESIILLARQRKWKEAEAETIRLGKAQQADRSGD